MKIHSVRIKNYKSIEDSEEINLHININALAGRNNTGKSAFIEAIYKVLGGNFDNLPTDLFNSTQVFLEVSFSSEEIIELNKGVELNHRIENHPKFSISFKYSSSINTTTIGAVEVYHENSYKPAYTNQNYFNNKPASYSLNYVKHSGGVSFSDTPIFLKNLMTLLKEKVVYIAGSRHVLPTEDSTLNRSLNINGTNLNGLLYTLHNNEEEIFDKIVETFIQIFPDVASIRTPINSSRQTFISVSFEGFDTPIPLSDCGSGYTHILLLLCVLYTKKNSVVLFDEPQVFLHPSAEKAIYDLVSEGSEHQFIFTTHSPILINYPSDKYLIHVSKLNGISSFTHLEQIQEVLSDIGINNSDYALSDKVIFVEGETEERVLPLILSHFGLKQVGYNYRILNMKGTGRHFTKKTAMREHKDKLDLVLSGVSQSPIPYKIIIDADNKKDEKINELRESYGENIVILERREYENYFLDCYQEISEIINRNLSTASTDLDQIKSEIDHLLSSTDDRKLFPKGSTDVLKDVIGSEVLERLFENHSLYYNKIIHGVELTELVLNNTPEKLEFFKNELQDFIKG